MKNKKWLLLLIIALPSLLWIILETSTINSYRLNYYGPKQIKGEGDTVYHTVSDQFLISRKGDSALTSFQINTEKYPFFGIMFIKESYKNDSYRLPGLWEYLNYKKDKIGHIQFFLVTEMIDGLSPASNNLQKLSDSENIHFLALPENEFDSLNILYFKSKPVHIDYSFFALIDNYRHIRGYYDGRYASEIKRLTEEYKHLRLKEEKQKLIKDNEIKKQD